MLFIFFKGWFYKKNILKCGRTEAAAPHNGLRITIGKPNNIPAKQSKQNWTFFYEKQVYNSCVKENQTFCFKVELGWTLNLNKDYLPSRNSGNFRPKPITKSRKQQQQLSAITPPPFSHRVYDNLILYQLFSKIPWGFFKFRDVVVESIPLSLSPS